ncbi:YlaF family protein [Macrococcus armenti]|uniref:DUF5325 family protein n=1 Tax=Macrococcus armenti TaxID=2875764 RepID=UPI001CCB51C7|nr:DUF5325 family protein [Macrococcus armenti]UBH09416.1 YlaF family protein [Macrococcus armenti]UBH11709.1 YlaF family protein [Macrococcus armenti]UBH16181.1 YlaF family protein [Macrococcus armenti]UBH18541.1 YlaF family protein [Macrococcus armenti]UBH20808.1 YlaF family protein [Macrococcus armenti]
MKKSTITQFIFACFAVLMLILFSIGLAEGNFIIMGIAIILFIATFGVGFTFKKKFRESGEL